MYAGVGGSSNSSGGFAGRLDHLYRSEMGTSLSSSAVSVNMSSDAVRRPAVDAPMPSLRVDSASTDS